MLSSPAHFSFFTHGDRVGKCLKFSSCFGCFLSTQGDRVGRCCGFARLDRGALEVERCGAM